MYISALLFKRVLNCKKNVLTYTFVLNIRGPFKKYREFCVFSKIIYLFVNIYFVPFKVIPIRYALVPTFFPILEALQKIFFVIVFSFSFDAVFISSIVA